MGATALVARIPLVATDRSKALSQCGLTFDELGGPFVAVCGMTGGAGTTTIAACLARRAAAESAAPVLLTEADPHRAGLAVLARRATAHPLAELARRVAEDEIPAETFVELEPGLRLVAAEPRSVTPADPLALCALLRDARDAHGLVVIDCGTHATADNPILAQATHAIWVVAATLRGLAGARALLDSDVMPPIGCRAELAVAVAKDKRTGVSVRALRRAFAPRCERLVLMPRNDALARDERVDDEQVRRTLAGLAVPLRRAR